MSRSTICFPQFTRTVADVAVVLLAYYEGHFHGFRQVDNYTTYSRWNLEGQLLHLDGDRVEWSSDNLIGNAGDTLKLWEALDPITQEDHRSLTYSEEILP